MPAVRPLPDNTDLYKALLVSHEWLGWIAIASAIVAIGTAFVWTRGGPGLAQRAFARGFRVSLAAQALTGVLLHLRFSPFTAGIRANVEVVLRDPTLRYWNAIHPLIGTLALGAAVCAPIYARRAHTAEAQTRRARWSLVLAAALSVAAIPWS
jgi:hypothetical protein